MTPALKYSLLFTGIWTFFLLAGYLGGIPDAYRGFTVLIGAPLLLLLTVVLGLIETRKRNRTEPEETGFFQEVKAAARAGGYFSLFGAIVLYGYLTFIDTAFIEERNKAIMEVREEARSSEKETEQRSGKSQGGSADKTIAKAFTPFKIASMTLFINVFLTLFYALIGTPIIRKLF